MDESSSLVVSHLFCLLSAFLKQMYGSEQEAPYTLFVKYCNYNHCKWQNGMPNIKIRHVAVRIALLFMFCTIRPRPRDRYILVCKHQNDVGNGTRRESLPRALHSPRPYMDSKVTLVCPWRSQFTLLSSTSQLHLSLPFSRLPFDTVVPGTRAH